MPVTNHGIEKLGSFLGGETVTIPTYISFGTGSEAFDATVNTMANEAEASVIVQTWVGDYMQYSAVLDTTQANGSSIGEIGISVGSPSGATIWARELSAIGDKTNTYSATVYMTWKITRT